DPADGKYQDWFELYNYGSNTVNLAGYFLTDTLLNKLQFRIPSGYTIGPRGYLLVCADNEPAQNSPGQSDLHVNFRLSKSGPISGLFTWRPTADQAPSTNSLGVRVTDDGAPPLSASTSFSVVVLPLPRISSLGVSGGNLHLVWQSVLGKTYRVQYTGDLATGLWYNLGSVL